MDEIRYMKEQYDDYDNSYSSIRIQLLLLHTKCVYNNNNY